jgi:hypothetical protein
MFVIVDVKYFLHNVGIDMFITSLNNKFWLLNLNDSHDISIKTTANVKFYKNVVSFYTLNSLGHISTMVHKLKGRTDTRDFKDTHIHTLRQRSDLVTSLLYLKEGKYTKHIAGLFLVYITAYLRTYVPIYLSIYLPTYLCISIHPSIQVSI